MIPAWLVGLLVLLWRFAYCVFLLYTLFKAAPLYARWMKRHPTPAIILGLLMVVVLGLAGKALGVRDLFWHQNAWAQFLAGLSMALIFSVVFALNYLAESDSRDLDLLAQWSLLEHRPAHWRWPAAVASGVTPIAVRQPGGGDTTGSTAAPKPDRTAPAITFLIAISVPLILLFAAPVNPFLVGLGLESVVLLEWRMALGLATGVALRV